MISSIAIGQIVINELDCDTPGVDNMEFVELLSDTPNFPLDGYVVVFFNGSENGGNSSYFTIDLDGFVTDINGLLLIGSNSVSPVPQLLIPENTIQNGADAVAIYQANNFNFPDETVATIDNLVDVLLYDTSDGDDEDMIAIFSMDPNFSDIEQINEGSSNNTNSIQRNNDGTYTSKEPTPRQLNDGSGTVQNGLEIVIAQTQYEEGETIEIQITTEETVADELSFEISLTDGSFTNSDFSGNTTLTIPAGENSTATTITLIDDDIDEGDEVAVLRLSDLPSEYLTLNDNIEIRIVDNDFQVANFGTPTNPTYGNVASSQPVGYYDALDAKSNDELRQAVQNIIADPNVVRAQTYTDIIDILYEADQNPANSNQVDDDADGINVFWNTSADSLRHGNSDAHALRAADGQENGSRNNKHYGSANSQWLS